MCVNTKYGLTSSWISIIIAIFNDTSLRITNYGLNLTGYDYYDGYGYMLYNFKCMRDFCKNARAIKLI